MKTFKTEPKIINIEDTNTTIIKLMFFNKHTKEDTIKNRIMNRILRTCNNLYRTPKEFETKRENLLIINLSINTKAYITKEITEITMTIPKEGIIEELNLEECKKMLNELDYKNYTILINREID